MGPIPSQDIHLLEGVQKFACKVCLKHWDWDYAEMLKLFNLPELQTRRKILKLSLLYKFVNNLAFFPEAPLDHRDIYYSTRKSHSLSFSNLHGRTYQYLHSFFPTSSNNAEKLLYNLSKLRGYCPGSVIV